MDNLESYKAFLEQVDAQYKSLSVSELKVRFPSAKYAFVEATLKGEHTLLDAKRLAIMMEQEQRAIAATCDHPDPETSNGVGPKGPYTMQYCYKCDRVRFLNSGVWGDWKASKQ